MRSRLWLAASLSRSPRIAGQDIELADDAAVLQLEDGVRQHLPPAWELAGDRRGGSVPVGDGVLHRCDDARAGAVLEHSAEHVAPMARARRARRVVPVDLDQLEV